MVSSDNMSDIAIIGYSLKLPQDVDDDESFWDVLQSRRNLMTKWPENRVKTDSFAKNNHQKWNGSGGHFIKEDVAAFDAPFFSVTAKEASTMDPMQRWTLEAAYHAFENAGLPVETLKGSRTAVFSASMLEDYSRMTAVDPDNLERTAVTGSTVSCVIPNRVSWYFDLHGPSIHVNTACSSSLSAVDMACKTIQSGDASCAIVTGANLLLDPSIFQVLANQGFLSPDGICYSFDERANGYSRGEGVIAVVLKPVKAAIGNGDTIRAVIRSIGSNQDGHTPILTQPSSQAQEELIRHVYEKAGLSMSETRYVEAHGTGTPVGDPIEMKAIGRCFKEHRSSVEPLYVGSVKANVGHLEGASALASLVKCIMILEKGIITPNAVLKKINPELKADFYNVEIPTMSIKWPAYGARRVSINSFGFGGSNTHIVLDDAFHYMKAKDLTGLHNTTIEPKPLTNGAVTNGNHKAYTNGANGITHTESDNLGPRLLVFTAADGKAAQRTIESYRKFHQEKVTGNFERLERLAFTLGSRRSKMLWRAFAVTDGSTNSSLTLSKPTRSSDDLGLAFMFTGQGAQYLNMGAGLEKYRVYKDTLEMINGIYSRLGCPWNIFDELSCQENINKPEYSQPLSTAIQIALMELLASFGITPNVVIGHSSGEIAAAYSCGALSLESACKVSYFRGLLAGKLRATSVDSPGAMISINLAANQVSEFLENKSIVGVNIACINSPLNSTLSGPEDAIDAVKAGADLEGIFAQKLKTGVAYHSPSMNAIADEYSAALQSLNKKEVESFIPMISTVTEKPISFETLRTAQYWVDNMLSTVKFSEALQKVVSREMARELGFGKITDIVEIGSHPALRRPVKDTLEATSNDTKGIRYSYVLHRSHHARQTVLDLSGQLFCYGYLISIPAANQQTNKNSFLIDCPKYPFDRSERYWAESRLSRDFRLREAVKGDLLGVRASDWNPLEPRWRNFWSTDSSPWIGDHKISDTVLFPASGMLIMAIEAAQEMISDTNAISGFLIEKAEFKNPIIVPETWENRIETQVRLQSIEQGQKFDIVIFTYSQNEWIDCFSATISVDYNGKDDDLERHINHNGLLDRYEKVAYKCTLPVDSRVLYHDAAEAGLQYGDWFRLMQNIKWDGKTSAVARIDVTKSKLDTSTLPHPALLDQAFHVLRVSSGQQNAANVPVRLESAWFTSKPWQTNSVKWMAESTLTVHGHGEQGRVIAMSENGDILCSIDQAVTSAVSREEVKTEKNLLYSIDWKPQLSLLSSNQLARLCDDNSIPKDESAILANHSKMCHTLELVAARVLKDIDRSKVPTDLQRHVEWMEHHVSKLPFEQQQEAEEIKVDELESRLAEIDSVLPAWKIYTTCARKLEEILVGQLDPLQVVFESDQAKIFYSDLFRNLCSDGQLNYVLDLAAHENPSLRILEVGAGTGGMTGHVISALQERERRTGGLAFSEYTYTDISPAFFEAASSRWPDLVSQGRITFKTFNLDRPADSQGFEPGSYDLIIAASVLHATPYLEATIRNVHKCLKPGGRLVLLEVINPDDIATNFMAGLVPGWWVAREEWRPHSAAIPEDLWHKCLQDNGFSGNDLVIRDYKDDQCHIMSVIVTTAMKLDIHAQPTERNKRLILIVRSDESSNEITLAKDVLNQLDPDGKRHTSIVPFSKGKLRTELADLTADDCVICLAEAGGKHLLATLSEEDFSCLQFLISNVSKLLWVTSSNLDDPNSPDYAVAQGFFRSIRAEQTDTHIVTLAIEDTEIKDTHSMSICKVFESAFASETQSKEVEYIDRNGIITTGRAIQDMANDSSLRSLVSMQLQNKPWSKGPALKLTTSNPGSMDSLQYIEDELYTSDLDPHEIEIEAQAWSLTNRDLEIALGRPNTRTEKFGTDCSGFVIRVGSQCDTLLRPGDRVGMMSRGCMRKYPRAHKAYVFKLPDTLSFEDSVSFITPGLEACYSMFNVARLQQNDSVLIHWGTRSAQMAAKLALTIGAQVIIASSSQKEKELLISQLGLPATHIFSRNSPSFSQAVLHATQGCGVDVVLDFSGGDALKSSMSSLATGGRVITTQKLGQSMAPMDLLARNITFSAVDISNISSRVMHRLTENVAKLLFDDKLKSDLVESFTLSRVGDALRHLQEVDSSERVQFIQEHRSWSFDSNSTYLVAGGSGGLGRAIIEWMVKRGARNLIVPSRSGGTSQAAAELISKLTSHGVHIIAPKCDVSIREDVKAMLDDCAGIMPPIKGCINAAMVLQDAIFQTNMSFKQWDLTIRSKINTSKNLHELLPKDLDFFILLSSLAGVVGQMASANYAGGCAYQDALARYRIAHGQKAFSLDIGWMRNIGIIAESEAYQRQRQTSNDMQPIDDTELLALLTLCCDPDIPIDLPLSSQGQILFGLRTPADVLKAGQQPPEVLQRPLLAAFSNLLGRNDDTNHEVSQVEDSRDLFQKSSDAGERQQIVVQAIAVKLARAMSISPDDVEPSKPLSSYGVDSLMAVELRNWINKEFSTKVAVFDIIGGVSIARVAETVVKQSSI
uniref:Putative polyketide synthase n=1 Tax=Fusarium aywerte TaxID=427292 RepID=A0A0U2RRA5_9HYPO|nr:putative polyketide synthase [Fusarium aywerte]